MDLVPSANTGSQGPQPQGQAQQTGALVSAQSMVLSRDKAEFRNLAFSAFQRPLQMDAHFQSSLSPTDFFNGSLDLNNTFQPGPRSYKSRKYRPCDFCRARQVACKIDLHPPCTLCVSHGRNCTFLEQPKKKRRPNNNSANNGESSGSGAPAPPQQFDASTAQLSPGFIAQYNDYHTLNGHDGMHDNSSPNQAYNLDPYLSMMQTRIRPLDSQGSNARFIGETGESNPYLLKHYHYDDNDECNTVSKLLTYRRIPNSNQHDPNNKNGPPVVFMVADDSLAQKGEPRIEDDVLKNSREELAGMFSEQEALRLIGLFVRFVYPYFPILSKSELFNAGILSPSVLITLPTSLLSAIYATALPFMLYDDLLATTVVHAPPQSHKLFRISWLFVQQELHTPRLATLQACLLLLQRAPTNRYTTDTPWKTSLVGWTVSLAQILGLFHDCGDWSSVPAWEMSLRKRLWYGTLIMDKWASLGAGMPSHIRPDDYDVLPLSDTDLEPANLDPNSNIPNFSEPESDGTHFRLLTELTVILSDIMDSFYTVRSTQRTSKDLTLSLNLAQPLRSRLKSWHDSMPQSLSMRQPDRVDSRGMARLSGNPSLSLAYIVATMTLFGALLRPLENLTDIEEQDHGIVGSKLAIRAGAKECAKEVVELVENLGRGALDAFWHSWSRANFAIASSFLMQLLVTSESENESSEVNDLVGRWRWAMRIGSGSGNTGNGGLMSLGLLRLDGLMLENQNGVVGQQPLLGT